MNLSYESVIDIIWPILRKYISDTENDKDKIFTSLKESFEKNKNVFSSDNLLQISILFEKISDKFREIEDVNNSLDYYIGFMDKIFCAILVAFKEKYKIDDERFNKKFNYYLESELKREREIYELFPDEYENPLNSIFDSVESYNQFIINPKQVLIKLKTLKEEDIIDALSSNYGDFGDYYGPYGQFVIDNTLDIMKMFDGDSYKNITSKEKIIDLLDFIHHLKWLQSQRKKIASIKEKIKKLKRDVSLLKFKRNKTFISDCKKVIQSLEENDRYHACISEAIESILTDGLYMVQNNLDNTSYNMYRFYDFDDKDKLLDTLLLFRTGFEGVRGEAMIFIKNGAKIRQANPQKVKNLKIDYSMTGPLGIKYYISPEDIIASIDTKKLEVKFGLAFNEQISHQI